MTEQKPPNTILTYIVQLGKIDSTLQEQVFVISTDNTNSEPMVRAMLEMELKKNMKEPMNCFIKLVSSQDINDFAKSLQIPQTITMATAPEQVETRQVNDEYLEKYALEILERLGYNKPKKK